MKLGFIVNPVAGIGGKVGLKGSDGAETYKKALALGAAPESGKKALETMKILKESAENFEIYTCPGVMGEDVCREAGLSCTLVCMEHPEVTTPEDTIRGARRLLERKIDLLLFAGGDGTARNICEAVKDAVPVIGIPTGCKIHSGVYAVNPRMAGELVKKYAEGKVRQTKEAEVMDIDEELFREGRVEARLYGYLSVPDETSLMQNQKSGSRSGENDSVLAIADYMDEIWEEDTLYVCGTGSTIRRIMERCGLKEGTLLGVDMAYGREIIKRDCSKQEILDVIASYRKKDPHQKVVILVTVIGGQGYIFGRGNQQISGRVIMAAGKENIIVAAARGKFNDLFGKPLYADTGDEEVNAYLRGYIRVIMGYELESVKKVTN